MIFIVSKYYTLVLIFFCLQLNAKIHSQYVKVNGLEFELAGKPYRFVGFNMFYAAYLGSTEQGQQRLIKELDLLKILGITNLRILGSSQISSKTGTMPSAIETNSGIYNEKLLKGLDFALFEMGKRGIYAVIFLNNFWNWSGGNQQYLEWADGESNFDPLKDKNWYGFVQYSSSFYSNYKAQQISLNYITMLINRKNVYSNIEYKNDPTIMSWQLCNEPRPGVEGSPNLATQINAFATWVDITARYIHSIDSNHLVSTGSEGTHGSVESAECFLKVHSSKYIDFSNFHLWAKNWKWYDARNHSGTYSKTIVKSIDYINLHISLARQLGKPITLEEFGFSRDSLKYNPDTPVKCRDMYFDRLLGLIADSAALGAPLVGVNIWAFGGYGIPSTADKIFDNPNFLLGDPINEGQGLNSVFATDYSTLEIIKKYNNKLCGSTASH